MTKNYVCNFYLCGGTQPRHKQIIPRLKKLFPKSDIVTEQLVHYTPFTNQKGEEFVPGEVADSELYEHLYYLLHTYRPLPQTKLKLSEKHAFRQGYKFTSRETADHIVIVSADTFLLAHANELINASNAAAEGHRTTLETMQADLLAKQGTSSRANELKAALTALPTDYPVAQKSVTLAYIGTESVLNVKVTAPNVQLATPAHIDEVIDLSKKTVVLYDADTYNSTFLQDRPPGVVSSFVDMGLPIAKTT